jgi:hypothetical protein
MELKLEQSIVESKRKIIMKHRAPIIIGSKTKFLPFHAPFGPHYQTDWSESHQQKHTKPYPHA